MLQQEGVLTHAVESDTITLTVGCHHGDRHVSVTAGQDGTLGLMLCELEGDR